MAELFSLIVFRWLWDNLRDEPKRQNLPAEFSRLARVSQLRAAPTLHRWKFEFLSSLQLAVARAESCCAREGKTNPPFSRNMP
ncbi:MAG: hypothetical protein ACYDC3_09480 [Candidatus Binataceae bacterium]